MEREFGSVNYLSRKGTCVYNFSNAVKSQARRRFAGDSEAKCLLTPLPRTKMFIPLGGRETLAIFFGEGGKRYCLRHANRFMIWTRLQRGQEGLLTPHEPFHDLDMFTKRGKRYCLRHTNRFMIWTRLQRGQTQKNSIQKKIEQVCLRNKKKYLCNQTPPWIFLQTSETERSYPFGTTHMKMDPFNRHPSQKTDRVSNLSTPALCQAPQCRPWPY